MIPASVVRVEATDRLGAVARLLDLVALVAQEIRHHLAHRRLVVHHQYGVRLFLRGLVKGAVRLRSSHHASPLSLYIVLERKMRATAKRAAISAAIQLGGGSACLLARPEPQVQQR